MRLNRASGPDHVPHVLGLAITALDNIAHAKWSGMLTVSSMNRRIKTKAVTRCPGEKSAEPD
jgi:hypothetical protein